MSDKPKDKPDTPSDPKRGGTPLRTADVEPPPPLPEPPTDPDGGQSHDPEGGGPQ